MMIDKTSSPSSLDYELRSLEEILGAENSHDFQFRLPVSPDDLLTRGILHRAGRAGFYYWMKHNSGILNWNDPGFKFSPIKKKIAQGLQLICDIINAEKGKLLQFENQPDHWEITTLACPADGETSPVKDCNYLAGFVQEFTSWAGLGKFYRVSVKKSQPENSVCCRVCIDKKPIDF